MQPEMPELISGVPIGALGEALSKDQANLISELMQPDMFKWEYQRIGGCIVEAADIPEWKAIRTMSDEDLRGFLENNDKIDPHLLAIVCSEVLRRMWKSKITRMQLPIDVSHLPAMKLSKDMLTRDGAK